MVQSLQLGTGGSSDDQQSMRRLNRLPIIVAIVIIVLFFGVVIIGLSWRGLSLNRGNELDTGTTAPATSFGDQLKRGVSDGIIGEPDQREVFQPTPVVIERERVREPVVERQEVTRTERRTQLEPEAEWRARLKREQDEQILREAQRQRMASMQARATALDGRPRANRCVRSRSSRTPPMPMSRSSFAMPRRHWARRPCRRRQPWPQSSALSELVSL